MSAMTTGFSGAVRISNISDFIEPEQKCILPLAKPASITTVGVHQRKPINTNKEPSITATASQIKVTLSDCLACSGCITTAETMLVESQTIDQMLKGIHTSKHPIVTVSPQSLCSLAVHYGVSPQEFSRRLTSYFRSLGVDYVVDSSFGRLLSRRLYYEEFKHAHMAAKRTTSTTSTIFTGVCPGFVCYAEKTHGQLLVPLISRVRSPQAISARLIKDYLARKCGYLASDIFHVAMMPCFDKKLEGSRSDFNMSTNGGEEALKCKEVDCVVTPVELQPLLDTFFASSPIQEVDQSPPPPSLNWLNRFEHGVIIGDGDTESSGGYTEYIAQQLLKDYRWKLTRERRAKDLEVITLEDDSSSSTTLTLTLAKLYGFRNIQNAVQKLKRDKLKLNFVEVMACPSGCGNGGGQIRHTDSTQRNQTTTDVLKQYSTLECSEDVEKEMDMIEKEWAILNPDYREHLFTDYHSLKSNGNIIMHQSW